MSPCSPSLLRQSNWPRVRDYAAKRWRQHQNMRRGTEMGRSKQVSLSLSNPPPPCPSDSIPSLQAVRLLGGSLHETQPASLLNHIWITGKQRGWDYQRKYPSWLPIFCCRGLKGECFPKSTTVQRRYHSSTPACGFMWRWRARTLRTDLPP